MRSHILRAVVLGLASLVLTACGGDGGDGKGATPASITIVSGNAQTGTVGTELPVALTVRVTDSGTRPVTGATVTWTVTGGGGTVTPTTGTTDSSGTASTRWTLGPAPGTNQATATVAGIPAVTLNATAAAGTTSSVTVTTPILQIYEGDTVQLVATARDASGNVLPGKTVTWSSGDEEHFPVSATGILKTWAYGPVLVSAEIDGVVGNLPLSIDPINADVTVGGKEVVLDWTTDRCEDLDVPDGPARFVRTDGGGLVMFSGNAPRYRVSRGADFNTIKRDCRQAALVSADRKTPESYENWEWLWAIYREGNIWHALVHNEFHDDVAMACRPGDSSPGNPCWYNSITYAVSTDGAGSFPKPAAPAHAVAPAPNAWVPPSAGTPVGNGLVEGYFTPSNIVRGSDGYYYSFLMAIPTQNWTTTQGLCVFRSSTLGDPSTWRAWDGSDFNLRMTSPYVTGESAPVCRFLQTVMTHSHVVYSTYLDRYVAVASGQGPLEVNGHPTCGFFYALSADLIHWSEHRLLVEASLPWCPADPSHPAVLEPVNVLYPSIVDHADTTVNFEAAGRTPYLYYTRFNDGGLDRDLMRVPLTFTRTN